MTSFLTARRRAEELAAALDGDRAAESAHPEVRELVAVASTLRSHADSDQVAPRAEFAADLRERLMAEAETVLTPQTAALTLPPQTRSRERRVVVAATVAVLVGGSATMATAAQSALPGEALYPVKLGLEQVQAGLATEPGSKGRQLLEQASDRLAEVGGLVGNDDPPSDARISGTLASFSTQADEGAQLLFESYADTRDAEDITTVREFAAAGAAELERLADQVPDDAHDELTDAAVTLRDIDAEAAELCHSCSDLPSVEVPGAILARGEVDRVLGQLGGATLVNDHPVVVPEGLLGAVEEAAADVPDAAGDDSGSDGGTSTTGPSVDADPLPSPDDVSTDGLLDPLLDGQKETSSGDSSTDGGTLDGLTRDLEDAVETLLPDTDTDLLP